MTKPSRKSANQKAIGLSDRPQADFRHDQHLSAADDEPYQPLITAAILTTTAFRMRDNDSLIEALRMLVRAVKPFESDLSEQQEQLER